MSCNAAASSEQDETIASTSGARHGRDRAVINLFVLLMQLMGERRKE